MIGPIPRNSLHVGLCGTPARRQQKLQHQLQQMCLMAGPLGGKWRPQLEGRILPFQNSTKYVSATYLYFWKFSRSLCIMDRSSVDEQWYKGHACQSPGYNATSSYTYTCALKPLFQWIIDASFPEKLRKSSRPIGLGIGYLFFFVLFSFSRGIPAIGAHHSQCMACVHVISSSRMMDMWAVRATSCCAMTTAKSSHSRDMTRIVFSVRWVLCDSISPYSSDICAPIQQIRKIPTQPHFLLIFVGTKNLYIHIYNRSNKKILPF